MHIYFMGVLVSLLIIAVSFLIKLRKIHKTKEVYIVHLDDIFFTSVCASASWITVIVFVVMCIKKDVETVVIKKF
jgi:amino acid transporter